MILNKGETIKNSKHHYFLSSRVSTKQPTVLYSLFASYLKGGSHSST